MVINHPLISVSLKTLLAPSKKIKSLIKEIPILTLFTVHVHVKMRFFFVVQKVTLLSCPTTKKHLFFRRLPLPASVGGEMFGHLVPAGGGVAAAAEHRALQHHRLTQVEHGVRLDINSDTS